MTPRTLVALAALALSAAPLAAGTPQFRSWDICTPGSFRVCASVSISLEYVSDADPLIWGNGDYTHVVVTIANLQGTPGHLQDDRGGIYWAAFSSLSVAPATTGWLEGGFGASMELEGGGSSATPYAEFNVYVQQNGTGSLLAGPVAGIGEVIWGCAGALDGWAESYLGEDRPQPSTCGGQFVLTIDFENRYELTPATRPGLGIYALDPRVTTCGSWPTECVPSTAVPEPATILLLATGLAGIGGVAVRRRRKQQLA